MAIRNEMEEMVVVRKRQIATIMVVSIIVLVVVLYVVITAVAGVLSNPKGMGQYFGEIAEGFNSVEVQHE